MHHGPARAEDSAERREDATTRNQGPEKRLMTHPKQETAAAREAEAASPAELEIPEAWTCAPYAAAAQIQVGPNEVLLTFYHPVVAPQDTEASKFVACARVVLAPQTARDLLRMLAEQLHCTVEPAPSSGAEAEG